MLFNLSCCNFVLESHYKLQVHAGTNNIPKLAASGAGFFIYIMKLNIYKILTTVNSTKDWQKERLLLISRVAQYLIKPNQDTLTDVLKPLGRLMKYYNVIVNISATMPLAMKKDNQDILFSLNEIILNRNGFKTSLTPFLINIVTHFKSIK